MQAIEAPCYVARMQSRRDDSRFVRVLGEIMDRTGLRPQTLATATGTDPSVISRWLSGGTRHPKQESIAAFAAGLATYSPDAADLIPALYESLGYMAVTPPLAPQVVRDNWDDDRVRQIWRLANIPADAKAGLVVTFLEHEDRAAEAAG
jgi:hypothetical protein